MNHRSHKLMFWVQDVICIILLIGMTGYTLYAITQMPETIPIHQSKGVADGWGSKWISLLMPGITLFTYALSLFFTNYLKKRHDSIIFISWFKLGCVIILSFMNLDFIQFVLG